DAGEVQNARLRHGSPALDELLVQRVELVGVGFRVFQPMPLRHRSFRQCGGRVRVVLEELGFALAVPAQVEAPEKSGLAPAPGVGHEIVKRLGNGELREAPLAYDVLDRGKAQPVQLGGRRLELVDLLGAEGVARTLVPVSAAHRVVAEAGLLAAFAPVRPGFDGLAAHASSPRSARSCRSRRGWSTMTSGFRTRSATTKYGWS